MLQPFLQALQPFELQQLFRHHCSALPQRKISRKQRNAQASNKSGSGKSKKLILKRKINAVNQVPESSATSFKLAKES